jgi:hypothetical protein
MEIGSVVAKFDRRKGNSGSLKAVLIKRFPKGIR